MPITLSTGRVVPNNGAGADVFGISADLSVTEGYDTDWRWWPRTAADLNDWHEPAPPFTPAEMIELCGIMAERWQRLAATITARHTTPPAVGD